MSTFSEMFGVPDLTHDFLILLWMQEFDFVHERSDNFQKLRKVNVGTFCYEFVA